MNKMTVFLSKSDIEFLQKVYHSVMDAADIGRTSVEVKYPKASERSIALIADILEMEGYSVKMEPCGYRAVYIDWC